jgi:hypothetical protein
MTTSRKQPEPAAQSKRDFLAQMIATARTASSTSNVSPTSNTNATSVSTTAGPVTVPLTSPEKRRREDAAENEIGTGTEIYNDRQNIIATTGSTSVAGIATGTLLENNEELLANSPPRKKLKR